MAYCEVHALKNSIGTSCPDCTIGSLRSDISIMETRLVDRTLDMISMRDKRDAASDRIKEVEKWCEELGDSNLAFEEKCEELETEIESLNFHYITADQQRMLELEKDRERLDWLCDQHDNHWHDICCWHIVRCDPRLNENVRSAIDAARSGPPIPHEDCVTDEIEINAVLEAIGESDERIPYERVRKALGLDKEERGTE